MEKITKGDLMLRVGLMMLLFPIGGGAIIYILISLVKIVSNPWLALSFCGVLYILSAVFLIIKGALE